MLPQRAALWQERDARQVLRTVHPALEGIALAQLPDATLPPPPPHTLWQAQALAAGSAELRESAFFRNSVASQHGAESFYCECNPTVDSDILTLPPAVAVLCVLGSAAAAHLAQPAQWTSARLYAAAAALAVSLFGIQQL